MLLPGRTVYRRDDKGWRRGAPPEILRQDALELPDGPVLEMIGEALAEDAPRELRAQLTEAIGLARAAGRFNP